MEPRIRLGRLAASLLSFILVLGHVTVALAQATPRYVVCKQEEGEKRCGVIDDLGAEFIGFERSSKRKLWFFEDGYAVFRVSNDGKVRTGLFDSIGHVVINPVYPALYVSANGMVIVEDDNGMCGYLNTAGSTLIAPQWTLCGDFVEGRAEVSRRTRTGDWVSGFINETGKLEIDYQFEFTGQLSEGRVAALLSPEVAPELVDKIGDAMGFIDTDGAFITDFRFLAATTFVNGMAQVWTGQEDGRYLDADSFCGYINLEGELIWPIEFATADDFTPEGVALVGTWDHETRESEYGFVRADGTWALAPTFDIADSFSDGLAWVRMKDGWHGYIDLKGERVLPSNFDGPFSEGIAETWESSSCRDECGCLRYVDRTGEPVFPFALATAVNKPFDENRVVEVDISSLNEVYEKLLLHRERGIIWPPGWNEPGAGDPNVICWPELEREQEKSKKKKKKKKKEK